MTRRSVVRVLERHLEARIIVALFMAVPSLYAAERGHLVIGATGLVLATAFVLVLPWSAPPARLRRLERRARDGVPARDTDAVLVGTIAAVPAPLTTPRGRVPCAAYWQRTVVETEEGQATADEASGSVELVLRCGDTLVTVEGGDAEVLFDPRRARKTRDDDLSAVYEELVATIGDRLVVSGRFVVGPDAGPHRATPRMVRTDRHRVVVALVGQPT